MKILSNGFETRYVYKKIQKKFVKVLMNEIKEWDIWFNEGFDEIILVSPVYGYGIFYDDFMLELIDAEDSMLELGHVKIGSL